MESHAHDEDSDIEGATAELVSLRIPDEYSGANICTALRKEVGTLSDIALTPTYVENEIADDSEDDILLIDLIPSTSNGSRDRAGSRGSSRGGTRGRGRGCGGRTAASRKRNAAAVMQTFPTTVPDFHRCHFQKYIQKGLPGYVSEVYNLQGLFGNLASTSLTVYLTRSSRTLMHTQGARKLE